MQRALEMSLTTWRYVDLIHVILNFPLLVPSLSHSPLRRRLTTESSVAWACRSESPHQVTTEAGA